jgi:hypothetical protein
MNGFGGMPGRAYAYSAAFHVAVVLMLFSLVHFHLFERKIDEEQPIVVQLVNVAPETHATKKTQTPPTPEKPKEVAQVEAPKPPPEPKPAPPKPAPPPESHPEPAQAAAPPPLPPPPEPQPKQEAKLEPQPEPKPQEAKAEPQPPLPDPPPEKPQPPKKKNDDLAFDTMLKNIAKKYTVPTDQPPQKQAAAVPQSSSQPIASLADRLSTSELDVVKQQIEQCWNVPAGARDAKDLTPEFRVYMNRDGTIQSATQLNPERNGDPYFQAAAEAAARALHNPHCQPLKLPPDKYDQWQTFTITFDPKDL